MTTNYLFAVPSESELNDLVKGQPAGSPTPWLGRQATRLPSGLIGVLWKKPQRVKDPIQPLLLVAHGADQKHSFIRFASLRSDLSPISAWCHVIQPERFAVLDSLTREADLGGLEAAWTGLVIAEAMLLTGRRISDLKITACLATQSYSLARANALWSPVSNAEVIERYDTARRLFRAVDPQLLKLRDALDPIWTSLKGATVGVPNTSGKMWPIVESLRALHEARLENDPNEALMFAGPLKQVASECEFLDRLSTMSPEQRVREFDKVVSALEDAAQDRFSIRRHALAVVAGYLATVAAGGGPSLALTEPSSKNRPEIAAWAYVIGGIGERIIWSSGFDGLGRLVARELMRPLRLDEAPTCDVSLDEVLALADPQLSDPFVHLRLKQARIVTVSLFPGVNVLFSLAEHASQEMKQPEETSMNRKYESATKYGGKINPWEMIADAIWPYLSARINNASDLRPSKEDFFEDRKYQKRRANKRPASQMRLPTKGLDEK